MSTKTKYATCPFCQSPRLRLEVQEGFKKNLLLCTCDNTDCKMSGSTVTRFTYTDADELAMYGLTLADVHVPSVEILTTNRQRIIKQYLCDTAG